MVHVNHSIPVEQLDLALLYLRMMSFYMEDVDILGVVMA